MSNEWERENVPAESKLDPEDPEETNLDPPDNTGGGGTAADEGDNTTMSDI